MDEYVKQELIDNITLGFKSLVSDVAVAKVPEEIFSRHFLPYFSGQKTPTQAEPVFAEWVSIAGNPMSPVDVIDKDNKTLFRVPPMFDTGMVTQLQGKTMREIFTQYDLYNNNLPQVANNFLNKALLAKSEGYTTTPLTSAQQEWNSILKRYDLAKPDANAGKSESKEADDDLIYE
jgi:hypothetical protein